MMNRIILYSPGCFFGTNLIGDSLKFLNGGVLKGPAILCASNSFAIVCRIMSGALFADGKFFDKISCCGPSNLILKPYLKPLLNSSALSLSGYSLNSLSNRDKSIGVKPIQIYRRLNGS